MQNFKGLLEESLNSIALQESYQLLSYQSLLAQQKNVELLIHKLHNILLNLKNKRKAIQDSLSKDPFQSVNPPSHNIRGQGLQQLNQILEQSSASKTDSQMNLNGSLKYSFRQQSPSLHERKIFFEPQKQKINRKQIKQMISQYGQLVKQLSYKIEDCFRYMINKRYLCHTNRDIAMRTLKVTALSNKWNQLQGKAKNTKGIGNRLKLIHENIKNFRRAILIQFGYFFKYEQNEVSIKFVFNQLEDKSIEVEKSQIR